jgi:HPt (histidine-containing phosphotransfer) domain-containing protein
METNISKESKYAGCLIEAGQRKKKFKFIDLDYLYLRTKSDPELIMQMISLYLEQTPPLIKEMKQSLLNKDWSSLYAAVHKIIPSFLIMGISADFENMARQLQEYTSKQNHIDVIPDLVLKLDNVCTQACIELTEEYNTIKLKNS